VPDCAAVRCCRAAVLWCSAVLWCCTPPARFRESAIGDRRVPLPEFLALAPAGRPARLVVLAVGAPGFGVEVRGTRQRKDVPVAAAFGAVLWRTPPPARPELQHGGRQRLRRRSLA